MKKILMALMVGLLSSVTFAELKVDPVFSSNMVLQQQKPITFFGTADKDASVKVEFNGKTVTAKADENGKWKAEFPAMNAGKTNYTVKISDGKKNIKLNDILIGEVWFCSGQSNMAMPIGKKFSRGWSAENCEKEVENAQYPEIRYANQKGMIAHQKILPAQYWNWNCWVKCEPKNADRFSAAAYFFGRKLHQDLNVPIGLIRAAWGGTRIEPWISLEGYKAAGLEKDLKTIERFDLDEEGKKAYEEKEAKRFAGAMKKWYPLFEQANAVAKEKAQGWNAIDYDDSSWKKATNQHPWKFIVRWYRTKFKLPDWMKDKKVTFFMRKAAEKADVYLNGKKIAAWEAYAPEKNKMIKIELEPEQLNQNGDNVLAVRGEYLYNRECSQQMSNVIYGADLSLGKKRFALNKNWKMNDEFVCTKNETGGKAVPPFINIPYKKPQSEWS